MDWTKPSTRNDSNINAMMTTILLFDRPGRLSFAHIHPNRAALTKSGSTPSTFCRMALHPVPQATIASSHWPIHFYSSIFYLYILFSNDWVHSLTSLASYSFLIRSVGVTGSGWMGWRHSAIRGQQHCIAWQTSSTCIIVPSRYLLHTYILTLDV